MRFSLWLPARSPWSELLAMASHAADTGWHGIWIADETGSADETGAADETGRRLAPALECWTALGGLAATVPGITLGGLVRDDCHRHPAVVTKIATTVDQLSAGRVVMGLMPGSHPDAFARLEECCQVVKCLAESDRGATMEGRYYRLHDAPLDPKPLQRPFPLLIWGDGDQRSVAIAARYGSGWATTGPPEGTRHRVAIIRQACQDIGRRPEEVAVSYVAPLSGQPSSIRAMVGDMAGTGVAEWIVDARDAGVDSTWRDSLDRFIAEAGGHCNPRGSPTT